MGPLWGRSSGLAGAEETVRKGSVPGTGAGCWDVHWGGLLDPRVPSVPTASWNKFRPWLGERPPAAATCS